MTSQNNILFTPIANDMFNMMPILNLQKNVKIILKALLFFHLNNIIFFLRITCLLELPQNVFI